MPRMKHDAGELAKTLFQVLAILALAAMVLVILHKGYSDIGALAQEHPRDFWAALARYVFRNLAGG